MRLEHEAARLELTLQHADSRFERAALDADSELGDPEIQQPVVRPGRPFVHRDDGGRGDARDRVAGRLGFRSILRYGRGVTFQSLSLTELNAASWCGIPHRLVHRAAGARRVFRVCSRLIRCPYHRISQHHLYP